MAKIVTVSDIRKEAQKLIESGRMPNLPQLLGAVAAVRNKYTTRIKAAQASGAEPEEGAPADFGGRVIPNPTGVKPEWDTEHKPNDKRYPGGGHMSTDNAPLAAPQGSIDNAEPTDKTAFPAPEDIER